MGRSYPSKEELDRLRRASEPTFVDQLKNAWDDFQAAGANSYAGANSEGKKESEKRKELELRLKKNK